MTDGGEWKPPTEAADGPSGGGVSTKWVDVAYLALLGFIVVKRLGLSWMTPSAVSPPVMVQVGAWLGAALAWFGAWHLSRESRNPGLLALIGVPVLLAGESLSQQWMLWIGFGLVLVGYAWLGGAREDDSGEDPYAFLDD